MHSRHPKIVWWKNLYWCPVISALLHRGLVIQLAYNSHRTLWPHDIHLPSCSTATQALIIWIRARGKGVEALLVGALLLIPANPNHFWTEVIQTREMFRWNPVRHFGILYTKYDIYLCQNARSNPTFLLTIWFRYTICPYCIIDHCIEGEVKGNLTKKHNSHNGA